MRRVLRGAACEDGIARHRAVGRGVQEAVCERAGQCGRAGGPGCHTRTRGISRRGVSLLSHDPRHGKRRRCRARSDPSRESPDARRRDDSESSWLSQRLDCRSAGNQAGESDAPQRAPGEGPRGVTRLSRDAAMTSAVDEHAVLANTWGTPRGPLGWLTSVDHKSVGLRFIGTALFFLALGGVLALTMRTQLARPETHLLTPQLYNQFFSVHGTTMMFLFAVPAMMGLGIYLVPLMIGTRNVIFPRLLAYAYWVYLIGGLFLYSGLLSGNGPPAGWFSYTPLSESQFDPTKGSDIWAQTITFTEISMMAVAVTLIVTIFKQRTPGMSLNRIPLFVWSILVTSFMVVFAMTTIATASFFLAADRLVQTRFFDVAHGGDPLLWQHLFWLFGHPEVYIIFLPATGIVSHLIPTFARRPMFGYTAIEFATIATGIKIGRAHV